VNRLVWQASEISIQDITEHADVGLGTFYNYFESKQAIFEAVLDEIRDQFNQRLNTIRQPVKDPATIMALTLKYCLQQAQDNDDWNRFLTYSGLADGSRLLEQDEEQCLQDIQRGAKAGRFKVEDVHYTRSLIMGMVRHVNTEISAARLGRNAIEHTIRYILRMLGLPDLVAKALADSRLPPVQSPALQRPARLTSVTLPEADPVDQSKLVG
jgi:AcrR family transcriptional regulator